LRYQWNVPYLQFYFCFYFSTWNFFITVLICFKLIYNNQLAHRSLTLCITIGCYTHDLHVCIDKRNLEWHKKQLKCILFVSIWSFTWRLFSSYWSFLHFDMSLNKYIKNARFVIVVTIEILCYFVFKTGIIIWVYWPAKDVVSLLTVSDYP